MNQITVLLVEDHVIVREGLRALLALESDITVVGEAGDGRKALVLTRKLSPDVVVMDIALPLLNGIEATRQILHELPDTKVLILSAHSDDAYVEKVMAIGASGYLIKQTAAHVLAEAIRRIHRGETVFSPVVSRRHNDLSQKADSRRESVSKKDGVQLSSRETEVLQLVAEGYANKQTADLLKISIKTVEKHRQSVMNKLCIHDTAGLTRYAIAAGIIESSVQVTII
jgi:DNA-binding NarL/FixJ family response regulator